MFLAYGFTQKNTDKNLGYDCGTSCVSVPLQWLRNKKNPFLVQLSVLSGRNYKEQLCL